MYTIYYKIMIARKDIIIGVNCMKTTFYDWCLLEENREYGEKILHNFVRCVDPKDDIMKLNKSSSHKIIIHCDICNTDYETYPNLLTKKSHHGCVDGKVIVPGYNDLLTYCLKDEYKYRHVLDGWRDDLNGSMELYSPMSSKKVFFTCEKCGYTWQANLNNVISNLTWCPVEKGLVALKGYNDFETYCKRLDKEKCDKILKSWSSKNVYLPSEITYGTKKNKIIFQCIDCNTEFISMPSDILVGHWCPTCMKPTQTSMPEQIIYSWLKSYFNKVSNRYKIDGNEADIFVQDLNLVIEYQSNWHKGYEQRDLNKLQFFKSKNYTVLWVGTYNPGIEPSNFIKHKGPNTSDNECRKLVKEMSDWINNVYQIKLPTEITPNILKEARKWSKQITYENSLEYWCNNIAPKWIGNQILEGWDYELNAKEGLDILLLTYGSTKKAWFKCNQGHSWKASINNMSKGSWCPICNKGHGTKKIKYVGKE